MDIKYYLDDKSEEIIAEHFENIDENGIVMSSLCFGTRKSIYSGKLIDTVTIGGVATKPEYRRSGAVREMLNKVFDMAPERGWTVSILHPFSFAYYRKFGYEKIADHKVIQFPVAKLDFLERCPDFVPVNSVERAKDCTTVYNAFALRRNIMFPRYGTWKYPTDNNSSQKTYIRYDESGKPVAYISFNQEQYFNVNVMKSVAIHVREIAFTTPQALKDVLGFLRMFEGEDETVIIHNAAMSPEIDILLKHYVHTKYTLIPDLSARILDVKAILEANTYPQEHGAFTVNVVDTLPFTNGTYSVEYQSGKAQATKVISSSDADITASMPSFTQLVYGYDEYDAYRASYMDGVEVRNPNSDFFKAFHKKSCGLFEHF